MKKSKYNSFFCVKDEHFIYNSYTNSFMQVEKEIIDFLKQEDIDEDILSKEDFEVLKSAGFIFENNQEENFILERMLQYNIRSNNQFTLNLTLIPTLACNFKCPYCYEKSRPHVSMEETTKDNIIKFISNQEHIKTLFIQWYGGEPLLKFENMVEITNRIKNIPFIKKKSVKIVADLTTNGYLLSKKVIKQLDKLNIQTIQITIDGLEETHNKRRPHISNKDSFKRILSNISCLLELQPNIMIHLRVNVDHTNKDEFPLLIKFLNDKFGLNKNFKIYPGFVQDTTACNTGSGCTLDTKNQLKFKLDAFYKYGINLGYYPTVRDNICMAQHVNSFVIDANGDITKCWLDVGRSDRAIANVNSKGLIDSSLLTKYLVGCNPFYDETCIKCNIFPICGGGCQHDRIENQYFSAHHNICTIFKEGLGDLLYAHYLSKNEKNEKNEN